MEPNEGREIEFVFRERIYPKHYRYWAFLEDGGRVVLKHRSPREYRFAVVHHDGRVYQKGAGLGTCVTYTQVGPPADPSYTVHRIRDYEEVIPCAR